MKTKSSAHDSGTGEIRVSHVHKAGKPITGAKVAEFTVPLEITQTDGVGMIECGFRLEWLDIREQGEIASGQLTCGAGCGSPWMSMTVTLKDGRQFMYRADARQLAAALVEHALSGAEESPP